MTNEEYNRQKQNPAPKNETEAERVRREQGNRDPNNPNRDLTAEEIEKRKNTVR